MFGKEFSLNNLKTMEVIDVSIGGKVGYISDFRVDIDHQRILSIILACGRGAWLFRNNYLEVPWEKVIKIGIDVILIDGTNLDLLQPRN